MPWKAVDVPSLRLQFINLVRLELIPVAQACRRFGVSRATGHAWLRRFDADPDAPLQDRSRRPLHSPNRTDPAIVRLILDARRTHRWGARKIHALLLRQGRSVPSVRAVHDILRREGLIHSPPAQPASTRFERSAPNELWQVDHKCAIEIARAPHDQLTVLDDHSRYLLRLALVPDRAVTTAWKTLWDLMGEVGMPQAILTDNAFSTTFQSPSTLSWFDANLIRLGVASLHGRPYHPQTQGKVERFHGTLQREFLPNCRRSTIRDYIEDAHHWRETYNTLRPHEAIGDVPPAERWRPSPRTRPAKIPLVQYPAGSTLRKVSSVGDVRWKSRRIMAGRGLVDQWVRIHENDSTIDLYFAHVRIRSLRHADFPRTTAML